MADVTTVEMQDGRKVDFAGKRKMLKVPTEQDGTQGVRFDFINGETRFFPVGLGSLTERYAVHGLSQKLGDCVAGVEDPDDMVIAIDELAERLGKGEWSEKRESTGVSGASIVIKAMCEAYGKSVEEIKAFVENTLSKNEGLTRQALYAQIKQTAKVKAIVERLEAEKATKASKINADELLAGL